MVQECVESTLPWCSVAISSLSQTFCKSLNERKYPDWQLDSLGGKDVETVYDSMIV